MPSYNKVIIAGNLTRDVELRYMPDGTAVADFCIATTRRWQNKIGEKKEETSFVNCNAFGKTAEIIQQYHAKGDPLLVEGRLKQETWNDKQSGDKRSAIKVVVESFMFIKPYDEEDVKAQKAARKTEPKQAAEKPKENNGDDSDVPF